MEKNFKKNILKVDFCKKEAAKYAVTKFHYSKTMPASNTVKLGVWEDTVFIGCVIYSLGANPQIGSPYNLKMQEVCELTRVALSKHNTPVSKIVSISVKLLKKYNPGIKLVVSYADKDQGHLGKIYQAMNWVYVGLKNEGTVGAYIVNGKKVHNKNITEKYGKYSDKSISTLE